MAQANKLVDALNMGFTNISQNQSEELSASLLFIDL